MANGCLLESWCMYKCRFAVDQAAKAAAPSEFELLEPVSRKDTSTVWQANGTQCLARVNLPRGGLSLTRLREAFGSVGVVSNPRFLSRAERIQARTLPGILLGVVSWPMNMKFTSSIALWSLTHDEQNLTILPDCASPTFLWMRRSMSLAVSQIPESRRHIFAMSSLSVFTFTRFENRLIPKVGWLLRLSYCKRKQQLLSQLQLGNKRDTGVQRHDV